jgi:hypothetical protein
VSLLGVLGIQALPAELHRLASDNAADGVTSGSSSHLMSFPHQLYSSTLGASARLTLVSETCGAGAPTVESFTGPVVPRFRSTSNGAHSRSCAGSVRACQTVVAG